MIIINKTNSQLMSSSHDKDLEQFSYELVIKTADKIEEIFLKKWIKGFEERTTIPDLRLF